MYGNKYLNKNMLPKYVIIGFICTVDCCPRQPIWYGLYRCLFLWRINQAI